VGVKVYNYTLSSFYFLKKYAICFEQVELLLTAQPFLYLPPNEPISAGISLAVLSYVQWKRDGMNGCIEKTKKERPPLVDG